MPELPEVETIRRDLDRVLKGKRLTTIEVRKPKLVHSNSRTFVKDLSGRTIKGLDRRGKLLIVRLDDPDLFLLLHLKMTGQLIYQKKRTTIAGGHPVPRLQELPNAFTHLIFHFNDDAVLYFNDLRQFGYAKLVTKQQQEAIVSAYGIEPLQPDFTLKNFIEVLRGRKTFLKNVLLDQTVIAGLGNIYVDESCFLAGLRPDRRADTLTEAEIKKLHQACSRIIKQAIKYRGTTFGQYRDGLGGKGNFVRLLKVYGRGGKQCLRCKNETLQKVKVAGRGTAFCLNCQK